MCCPVAARKKSGETTDRNTWPQHFPKDCPPQSARPVNERVYRRSAGNVVEDALSASQVGTHSKKPAAQRAGLSCYLDPQALQEVLRVHEDWTLVCADLIPAHGMIQQTGAKEHHSLWLTRDALASYAILFKVSE